MTDATPTTACPSPAFLWKLWIYTNYDCNLRCSYCVAKSSPNAPRRSLGLANVCQLVDEAVELGFCDVFFTGGEPFLYPHIFPLIDEVLKRGKHIYLCTNALLLEKALDSMKPHPNFVLNIHMDGMEETHDRILERQGTFKIAIAAIKKAKSLGFRVCTNTTIFKETDLIEIEMLFSQAASASPSTRRSRSPSSMRSNRPGTESASTSHTAPAATSHGRLRRRCPGSGNTIAKWRRLATRSGGHVFEKAGAALAAAPAMANATPAESA